MSDVHRVANVYAVWPVYNVKCQCFRGDFYSEGVDEFVIAKILLYREGGCILY